jgi:uncharacterized protein (DUF2252 family)
VARATKSADVTIRLVCIDDIKNLLCSRSFATKEIISEVATGCGRDTVSLSLFVQLTTPRSAGT